MTPEQMLLTALILMIFWAYEAHLLNQNQHVAELKKKIADLESLTIVQENLPVPALRRRIAELEAQLLARNPEITRKRFNHLIAKS